jgi:hypothetical protein
MAVSNTLIGALAPLWVDRDCAPMVPRLAINRPVVLAEVSPKVISSTDAVATLFGPTWNWRPVAWPAPLS